MKGKVAFIILSIVLAISAYQIFAHNGSGKASSEIFIEQSVEIPTTEEIWAENKDYYNSIFEQQLKTCAISKGPQKNYVQVSNPEIRILANSLAKRKGTQLGKTKTLFDYVSNEYTYKSYENWRSTSEVLETKDGDCTDKSILLISLLKNADIDAFVVYGKEIDDYSHAWVVANIDGSWMQLDSTTGEFFYFYDCLEDENCEYKDYYIPLEGMFDEKSVLDCGA